MATRTFKDWFEESGFNAHSLAKICGVSPSTVTNILKGTVPLFRTVKRLVRVTKKFNSPITYEMFPLIYRKHLERPVPIEEVIKNLK